MEENGLSYDCVSGYSHLASYIINREKGALTREELSEADQFVSMVKREYGADAQIVSVGEETFFGYPEYGGKLRLLVMYNVLYTKKDAIPDIEQKEIKQAELFV